MFDFLVNGTRVLTSDDVAHAVLEYTRALAERGQSAVVTFPAVVDGHHGETWMSVGAGMPMVAVRSDPELPLTLDGTEFAVWHIRRRTAELTDGANGVDTDIRS
jgi:hypothetical protein